MRSFIATASLLATTLTSVASAIPLRSSAVKRDRSAQIAVYYGQGDGQPRLNEFCDDPNIDIIPIGFVNGWPKKPGNGGWPSADFGNQCGGTEMEGTKMFQSCFQLVEDVAYCHSKGKKVLISIGGHADSTQVLANDADGEEFADYMWHMFGPKPDGWTGPRPFGDSIVDGFDFDVEANGNVGYGAMAKKLRENMAKDDPSGKYLLTAAPQCPTPDAQLSDAISKADFDYLFIQFYNTKWCSARAGLDHSYGVEQNGGKPTDIGFSAWVDWVAQNAAGSPSLFVGLPGSTTALKDASMYLNPTEAQTILNKYHSNPSFGGVMIWEATAAMNNNNFVGSMKKALNQCECGKDSCEIVTTTTTTTTTVPTTTTTTTTVPTTTTTTTTVPTTTTTTVPTTTVPTTTATPSTSSSTSSSTTKTSESTTTTSAIVSSTTSSESTSSATTTSTSSSIMTTSTTESTTSTTTHSHSIGSTATTSETSSVPTTTSESSTSTTTHDHTTSSVESSTTTSETSSVHTTTSESTTISTTHGHTTSLIESSTTTSETSSPVPTTSSATHDHSTSSVGSSTTSKSSSVSSTSTFSHSHGSSTVSETTSATETTTMTHSGHESSTTASSSSSVDATTSSVSHTWGPWSSTSASSQTVDPISSASSSSPEHTWAPWSTTSSKPVDPTSSTSSSVEQTWAQWSTTSSSSQPVDPTTSSSSSAEHTWAPWSTTSSKPVQSTSSASSFSSSSSLIEQTWVPWSTTSSKPVDPASSTTWAPWSATPSGVYVTSTTTVYTDVCPTGFTRVTATITATVTVTDIVNQPTGKNAAWPTGSAGVPTGFYATTIVCSTGCAATPITVTVTIPVPTGAITKTIVPTAATPVAGSGKEVSGAAASTPVEAVSGKPTGVASGTGSGSAWSTGSPIAGSGNLNGVKAFTGAAAADQAPATLFSVAVCVLLAAAGLVL
ncbi:Chitinase 2 [Knufia fluminis]|uniref:chitinase n=1 Tax=Knufia fluminis TaxID=191047 RepID=A0AAN8I585_9EURO|nr:Chitinase 2 [Knufia fluminis]